MALPTQEYNRILPSSCSITYLFRFVWTRTPGKVLYLKLIRWDYGNAQFVTETHKLPPMD